MANNSGSGSRLNRAKREMRDKAGKLTARIVSLEGGVEEYTGVSVIHVKSRYYNLLIMEGYTPSVGEIEGTVTIVSDTDSVKLENIRGFYLHKKNVFRLMIREGENSHVR